MGNQVNTGFQKFIRSSLDRVAILLQAQPQSFNRIQLRLTLYKGEYQQGTSYYQGPWDLTRGDTRVARGHLMARNKIEIMAELARQVNYFLENVAIQTLKMNSLCLQVK